MAGYEPPTLASAANYANITDGKNVDGQKISHLTEMSTLLNGFRADDSFCDVTIRLGERTYRAHKVILASTSRLFRTMFTAGYRETAEPEVSVSSHSRSRKLNIKGSCMVPFLSLSGWVFIQYINDASVPKILGLISYGNRSNHFNEGISYFVIDFLDPVLCGF